MKIKQICALFLMVIASGCASAPPKIRLDTFSSPTLRVSPSSANIRDGRVRFATAFREAGGCAISAESGGDDCRRWLDLPKETTPPDTPRISATAPQVTMVIVGGIFGECVAPWVSPYSASEQALAAAGVARILRPPVEGRSSSERNAVLIDAYLKQQLADDEMAVVVGYSKGLTDFLESFVRYGDSRWTHSIKAVVSVAGVVNGTPVADAYDNLYHKLRKLPFSTCAPGDGGGVHSLRYDADRAQRYAQALARAGVASYTLSAVVTPERVNPFLALFHRQLSRLDERNDGQMLLEDSLLPGTELLAIAHADHWAISLPFSESADPRMKLLSSNNAYPRTALIVATLRVILIDMEEVARQQGATSCARWTRERPPPGMVVLAAPKCEVSSLPAQVVMLRRIAEQTDDESVADVADELEPPPQR